MNEFSHMESSFDPQVLDRLVDGELAETERRDVLQTLDRQPDGWRQCALAFLEAQTWGQTLTEYARKPAEAAAAEAAKSAGAAAIAAAMKNEGFGGDGNVPVKNEAGQTEAARLEAAHQGRWRTLLAVAGSFLVTFSLGMYAQRYLVPSSSAGEASGLTARKPDVAGSGAGQLATAGAGGFQMQYVDILVTASDGRQQRVRAPLVDRQFAQLFMPNQTPAVPDEVLKALQRAGNQLRFRREFWPVTVGDQQALVPLDRYEVVPIRQVVQ
jgi:hypothetical protein